MGMRAIIYSTAKRTQTTVIKKKHIIKKPSSADIPRPFQLKAVRVGQTSQVLS